MNSVKNKIFVKIFSVLSSNNFFYTIIGLVVIQALWYAFSLQPIIYDEGRHLGFILIYTEHLSPFITNQEMRWDVVGEVTRDASYLYYYLMNFPLRFIDLFTDNFAVQVIFLRLINIFMFVGGILLYRKLFFSVGISKIVTNITVLFFVLTPSIAALPGAINYDNLIFLLFAYLLYLAQGLLKAKKINSSKILIFLALGMFGSIIKFPFIALYLPVAVFVLWSILKRHKKSFLKKFLKDYVGRGWLSKILIIVILAVGVGLFIERPVTNIFKYGDLTPSCKKVINETRCLSNFTENRNITVFNSKPDNFQAKPAYFYATDNWIPNMIQTQSGFLPWKTALPMMVNIFTLIAFAGSLLILLYFRDFFKEYVFAMLLTTMVFYSFVLFYQNYSGYEKLGQVVATSGRYFLPVIPIFLLFSILAAIKLSGKFKNFLLIPLIFFIIIFTQGGGIITFIINMQRDIYWQNNIVLKVNDRTRETIKKFVIENRFKISPF